MSQHPEADGKSSFFRVDLLLGPRSDRRLMLPFHREREEEVDDGGTGSSARDGSDDDDTGDGDDDVDDTGNGGDGHGHTHPVTIDSYVAPEGEPFAIRVGLDRPRGEGALFGARVYVDAAPAPASRPRARKARTRSPSRAPRPAAAGGGRRKKRRGSNRRRRGGRDGQTRTCIGTNGDESEGGDGHGREQQQQLQQQQHSHECGTNTNENAPKDDRNADHFFWIGPGETEYTIEGFYLTGGSSRQFVFGQPPRTVRLSDGNDDDGENSSTNKKKKRKERSPTLADVYETTGTIRIAFSDVVGFRDRGKRDRIPRKPRQAAIDVDGHVDRKGKQLSTLPGDEITDEGAGVGATPKVAVLSPEISYEKRIVYNTFAGYKAANETHRFVNSVSFYRALPLAVMGQLDVRRQAVMTFVARVMHDRLEETFVHHLEESFCGDSNARAGGASAVVSASANANASASAGPSAIGSTSTTGEASGEQEQGSPMPIPRRGRSGGQQACSFSASASASASGAPSAPSPPPAVASASAPQPQPQPQPQPAPAPPPEEEHVTSSNAYARVEDIVHCICGTLSPAASYILCTGRPKQPDSYGEKTVQRVAGVTAEQRLQDFAEKESSLLRYFRSCPDLYDVVRDGPDERTDRGRLNYKVRRTVIELLDSDSDSDSDSDTESEGDRDDGNSDTGKDDSRECRMECQLPTQGTDV